jgi:two-component system cell cycle sensor histidine kinase/response regulator CckA
VASYDSVRRRKDGVLVNVSVNIFPIEVRGQELIGASKISRDVTAIKKLEARFIEAQKMEVVGQLAAGTAHDFNNFLSAILGRSDLILLALGATDPMRGEVETIRQAAANAAGLARQLLIFSRMETPTPVVLDVNDVVKSLDTMLRQLTDKSTHITIALGAEVEWIKADSGHLGQVLLNLVVNARDAMPDGGELTIATSNAVLVDGGASSRSGVKPGSYVLLTVSDTGTGLTDEVRAHLFEPFFTTKPKGKGTGLGLATCDIIAKQYGGHIDVFSELGRGTTFEVYFPAAEPIDVIV